MHASRFAEFRPSISCDVSLSLIVVFSTLVCSNDNAEGPYVIPASSLLHGVSSQKIRVDIVIASGCGTDVANRMHTSGVFGLI